MIPPADPPRRAPQIARDSAPGRPSWARREALATALAVVLAVRAAAPAAAAPTPVQPPTPPATAPAAATPTPVQPPTPPVTAPAAAMPDAGTPAPPATAPTPTQPSVRQAAPAPASTPAGSTAALAPGEQQVMVYLRGLPAGSRAFVQRGEEPPVEMSDPGLGVLAARLRGPPARFLPLRLLLGAQGDGRYVLYEGLVLLADQSLETVAFQYQDQQALRLPVSPSARTEVALDQRVSWWVSFGWGALALLWLGVLGVVWASRKP